LREQKPEGVENEAVEQVAFADVLVINKTDLVSATELTELKAEL
jgi:G3E family GTPase